MPVFKTKEYKLISKSKYFDKKWYLASYPEVNETGLDPVMHYLRIGWKEGKNNLFCDVIFEVFVVYITRNI